ncbi:MAG: hypothetical protein ACI4S4_02685 [Candidatus Ornithospirochaeta sp.]
MTATMTNGARWRLLVTGLDAMCFVISLEESSVFYGLTILEIQNAKTTEIENAA